MRRKTTRSFSSCPKHGTRRSAYAPLSIWRTTLFCDLLSKAKHYALCSPFPLYTHSDHLPLNWIDKTEKEPTSSFITEKLSGIETIHQHIQGRVNTIPDACSRYPMLGTKQLATRGFTNSVEELLKRLPACYRMPTWYTFTGERRTAN
jgi:hypothetical protein